MPLYLTDYRAYQRTDLRDVGASQYFSDADLDGFHRRALQALQRFVPLLKPYTLSLVAGQDTYTLPADWLDVHRPSFEQALGLAGAYQAVSAGYGVVYQLSENLHPQGWAEANPYDRWAVTPSGRPPTYTFLNGSPRRLVIQPAPASPASYPMFYLAAYNMPALNSTAPAVADTVSDADSDAVLTFACHLACDAILSDPTALQTLKVGDRIVDRKEVAKQLGEKSGRKLAEFDRTIRNRPIGGMA